MDLKLCRLATQGSLHSQDCLEYFLTNYAVSYLSLPIWELESWRSTVKVRHNYSLRTLSSSMFCMPASKSAASAVPAQPGCGRFGEEAYSGGEMRKNKYFVPFLFQLRFTTAKDFVVPTYFVFPFSYFLYFSIFFTYRFFS